MSLDRRHPDYIDLRARIRAIVGAGLSRPCGLPGWGELRDHIVEHARARVSEVPEPERKGYEAALARISGQKDLWLAFAELQKTLPAHAYSQCITDHLTLKDRSAVPESYDLLWSLGIKGVVTFNIDTCSIDSYARVNKCAVDTATAKDNVRFSQFLTGDQQFVFQPHGNVRDRSTWVFTHEERTHLLGSEAYTAFMQALCQSKHLLVIGFDPSDFAFAYLVQKTLAGRPTTGSKHYMLLPCADPGLAKTFSEQGFAVIPYEPSDPVTHPEIAESLKDILSFIPRDDIAASVYTGAKKDPASLPNDDELLKLPIHELRELLNGAVASILPPDKVPAVDDVEKLEQFYLSHLRAIHMAWLIQPDSDCDLVHGYRIVRQKGRGAFGQVYEAQSLASGERAAIKVLLPEVRHNREYLNSFRRGVRSMRILTERHVNRMVRLIDAYEVPACILMDYIDGPTLTEAVNWRLMEDIETCLGVLVQVGEVVHEAHNLEERVLHRDLKPDNVILRDGYNKGDAIDVVVVDFDLSWHKGALDMSVVHGARAQGEHVPRLVEIRSSPTSL
jgi:hypothetical protein